jgi:AAHS family 4-hydroxybenzoate transporter-like MFS transporter
MVELASVANTPAHIIDRRPLSRFQLEAILLCLLVMVLDGFNTQSIGYLAPAISESLRIPLTAFGPVFAAGLFGLMIAAIATGPIADLWGRKWPLIVSTFLFAIFAVLNGHATSLDQLIIFRFLTGVGVGGALPNTVALSSEYAPKRLLPIVVAILFCGMPLGSLICGIATSFLTTAWGWQSVFYLGGILSLIVGCILIVTLPESVQFLMLRGSDPQKVRHIMWKISPELRDVATETPRELKSAVVEFPVKQLFTEGRAASTLLLWVPFFMNLLILYFIVSWLPSLLRQVGMPASVGILAVSLFSGGGIVACLAQGPMMNALGAYRVLFGEFALCTLLIGSLSSFTGSFTLTSVIAFFLGACVTGTQGGLNVIAAMYYPTSIRSTGVGWALGIGRIGSMVGPMFAGIMLSAGWSPHQILLTASAPAVIAAASIVAISHRIVAAD